MVKDISALRAQADVRFRKEERLTDAAAAMSAMRAANVAEQAKTARLREMRLAKEAADRTEAASHLLTKAASSKSGGKRSMSAGPRSVRLRAR